MNVKTGSGRTFCQYCGWSENGERERNSTKVVGGQSATGTKIVGGSGTLRR